MISKITKESGVEVERTLYEYNLQDRLALVKVSTDGGTTWDSITEYKYDPAGNRVSKTVDSVTTDYLIDSQNLTGYSQVFVEKTGGNKTAYIIGDDVIAQATGNTVTDIDYLLYDGHGSTRQLADNSGNLIANESYSYDSYGVLLGGQRSTQTSLLYTGEKYDSDAKMYYLRARYYDPMNGRFNQVDTFAGSPQDPQSLHKYLYAHDNPINRIDPSGKFTITEVVIGIAVISLAFLGGYTLLRGARFTRDLYLTSRGRSGKCGDDVTKTLIEFKKQFNTDSQGWDKEESCANRLDPLMGWDITTLVNKAVRGSTGSCQGTATVQGKCYDQSAINYYLWGLGCKYCEDTEQKAIDRVYKYKMWYQGGEWHAVQQAYGFTRAGYRGATNFDMPSLTSVSHDGCAPNVHPHWEKEWAYHFGNFWE